MADNDKPVERVPDWTTIGLLVLFALVVWPLNWWQTLLAYAVVFGLMMSAYRAGRMAHLQSLETRHRG